MMYLPSRVIATEGPKRKDGQLQNYVLKHAEMSEPWITWGHPPENEPDRGDIVGRTFNTRFENGKLVADMDIWDDRLSDEQKEYLKNHQDASIGYWYRMEGNDRLIKSINHVAIGIEKGVCSAPTCGLNVAADYTNPHAVTIGNDGIKLYTDEILEENSLTGQDEKEKKDSDAELENAVLKEKLAGLQEELAKRDADAAESLVTILGKRLGQDACAFKGLDLDTLRTVERLTQKVDIGQDGGLEIEMKTKDKDKTGQDEKPSVHTVKGPWAKEDYIGAEQLG
jgi:hypothetical protein